MAFTRNREEFPVESGAPESRMLIMTESFYKTEQNVLTEFIHVSVFRSTSIILYFIWCPFSAAEFFEEFVITLSIALYDCVKCRVNFEKSH